MVSLWLQTTEEEEAEKISFPQTPEYIFREEN